jgi:hypothetical protein
MNSVLSTLFIFFLACSVVLGKITVKPTLISYDRSFVDDIRLLINPCEIDDVDVHRCTEFLLSDKANVSSDLMANLHRDVHESDRIKANLPLYSRK